MHTFVPPIGKGDVSEQPVGGRASEGLWRAGEAGKKGLEAKEQVCKAEGERPPGRAVGIHIWSGHLGVLEVGHVVCVEGEEASRTGGIHQADSGGVSPELGGPPGCEKEEQVIPPGTGGVEAESVLGPSCSEVCRYIQKSAVCELASCAKCSIFTWKPSVFL